MFFMIQKAAERQHARVVQAHAKSAAKMVVDLTALKRHVLVAAIEIIMLTPRTPSHDAANRRRADAMGGRGRRVHGKATAALQGTPVVLVSAKGCSFSGHV